VTATKAAYEAELAKLRKEAEELAKAKKRLLAVQQGAKAAKEIQRQKAEIAKLQEELCVIKVKQSLSFNQPSPQYSVPNQSTFTKGNMPFTQPLRTPPSTAIPSLTPLSLVLRTTRSYHPHEILGPQVTFISRNSSYSLATPRQASSAPKILGSIRS
jgi:hypothetical protein